MPIETLAPAKVNLTLHVTGRRVDGYHLLDSLVAFADVGDRLRAQPAAELTLTVAGPRAEGVPTGPENLVLRAAGLLQRTAGTPAPGAALHLDKHLPAAAGIGGGSSDAAAALRLLTQLWRRPLPPAAAMLDLGADLPVCLLAAPARMRGIGEALDPLPALPDLGLVLANPGVATPTPAIFAALACRDNPPMPAALPVWRDAAGLAGWLAAQRNDLEPAARRLVPAIDPVLAALAGQPDCLLARMSGSGATCFGLFPDRPAAAAAAAALARARPGWWVAAGGLHRPDTG